MRVLQVHNHYRQRGGEDSVVAGERALLQAAGHQVEVVEFHNPSGSREAAAALVQASWNRSSSSGVVEAAKRFDAEVVHVHNTWFALSPVVLRSLHRARIPTVVTIHNYRNVCVNALLYRGGGVCELCVGRFPWKGIRYRCYRDSALQSTAVAVTIGTHRIFGTWDLPEVVIALTKFAVPYIEQGGIPAESILVKANFVSDAGIRSFLPSQSRNVLFVGRLSEEKGVVDLLHAWDRADTSGLRLAVIGDGPLRGLVESTAESVEGVDVLGSLDADQVMEAMKSARVLAFPSRWYEGMPMVLLEALSAGLGTILPNHGGLEEVAGNAGLIFEGGSVRSLSETLSKVGDDALVDQLGSAGRLEYQRRYSPTVGLEALEDVYRLAVDRRGPDMDK